MSSIPPLPKTTAFLLETNQPQSPHEVPIFQVDIYFLRVIANHHSGLEIIRKEIGQILKMSAKSCLLNLEASEHLTW